MTFFCEYEKIRNKIRQYDPISIIEILISISHDLSKKNGSEWNGYLPWSVLLLMKWVIANYELVNAKFFNRLALQANMQVVNELLNELQELFDNYRTDALTSTDDNKIQKFMRQCSFQQFWFQKKLSKECFARQFHLFCNTSDNNLKENIDKVDALFKKQTGISIFSFFEISLMVWTKFNTSNKNAGNKNEYFITKEWFVDLQHSLTSNEIDAYFKLLSLSLTDAKKYATKDLENKKKYLEFQILEQSPFTFYPFLQYEEKYFLYSPKLLDYVIEYFVYDLLKLQNDGNFFDIFGKSIFENYITKGLKYSGIDFIDEDELSKRLPKQSKKVDFLIEIENCAILIDAKACEMDRKARATQNNESIVKTLKKNVIKGIQQAYTVASQLQNKEKIYAIIVTYKELYLGAVGGIWDEFLRDSLGEFFQETEISQDIIKPENIYVISIKDFDNLMKCIKNNSLVKILEHVSIEDKKPGQGKHIFGLHLKDFLPNNRETLPYLKDDFNKIVESIENRFKHNMHNV
jgi:hypothetical protein